MKEKKKAFIKWIKDHKKELIVAGIGTATLILVVRSLKKHNVLEELWKSLRDVVAGKSTMVDTNMPIHEVELSNQVDNIGRMTKKVASKKPHETCRHIRDLPKGWSASEEKIATARANGIKLEPGQTWVREYSTGKMRSVA